MAASDYITFAEEDISDIEPLGDQLFQNNARKSAAYNHMFKEGISLIADVFSGEKDPYFLRKFMEQTGSQNFSQILGDILDRQLYARYNDWTVDWEQLSRRRVVRDFREVKAIGMLGGNREAEWINEYQTYPEDEVYDEAYTFSVGKYGMRFSISWEAVVNDDLGALMDFPMLLAATARRFEYNWWTDRVEALGTQASTATDATKMTALAANAGFLDSDASSTQTVPANASLNEGALLAALDQVKQLDDPDGRRLVDMGQRFCLMIPQNLEMATRVWLGANQIRTSTGGGVEFIRGNVVAPMVDLLVNPYLSNSTAWYLIPKPMGMIKPFHTHGRLMGHETPQIFVKMSNATAMGAATGTEFSFENETREYKMRAVVGGIFPMARTGIKSAGTG